jgi:small subunit ribosomal protein S4
MRPGEVVELRGKSKKLIIVEEGLARSPARPVFPYVEVDKENLTGKLTSLPERVQIPLEINEALIMEHYTRYM